MSRRALTANHEAKPARSLEITTPEGVQLELELATLSDRVGAWLFDMFVIILGIAAVVILLVVIGSHWSIGFAIAFMFVVRNAYFPIAEIKSGTTFGKRRLNLQVVATDGGPLTAGMVLARNMTKELEVAGPLTLVFGGAELFGSGGGLQWIGFLWLVAISLIPVFSRRRARLGDLIAGTAVVRVSRATLLPDLASKVQGGTGVVVVTSPVVFTPAQLDIYGIAELHVLEDLLRRVDDGSMRELQSLDVVVERIQRKIRFEPGLGARMSSEQFLRVFYEAQRSRLEQKLLHGRRQERKVR